MIKPGLKDLWQYVSRIFVLSLNELCHSNTTAMEKFFTRLCYKQMRKHQEWLIDEVFIFVFFGLPIVSHVNQNNVHQVASDVDGCT